MDLPKRYESPAAEPRWQAFWDEQDIYRFEESSSRPVFSIDTPPPTVSGHLSIGHVFSYTHTDLVARFQRMRGKNVFYPMGWDDNGLPTERRVQNLYKVRCDPRLPYDPEFRPDADAKQVRSISRRNFLELCARATAEDEKVFETLWRRLGLSVDWTRTYATVDAHSRHISQLAFLDLVEKGEAYSADAPTMWDTDFHTAIAQAETEERETTGLAFRLRFGVEGGGTLPIMTTRPELLAACVGVIVHPHDERYEHLVGGAAVTPGYRARVPVLAHPLADPEKGTGAAMVCTFGDATDVTWWENLDLATRMVLGRDGRILPIKWGRPGWESLEPAAAQMVHDRVAGLSRQEAKHQMAAALADPSAAADGTALPPLDGDPTPVRQELKFYEKGDRPLEILLTRQWFVRLLDKKEALLRQGRQVRWHPEFMRTRYDQWVEGLHSDWCVSRQRHFGVPIPLWYRLNEGREPDYDQPLLPSRDALPMDPMAEAPAGYAEEQRDEPGGFAPETDVLDTWATSSLTPQISGRWRTNDEVFGRLYPMDMRPQAHEIIRTWAFYTIARALMLDGQIPWRNAVISGLVLDPERKKMSKSKGNVVTPMPLLQEHGADAVRYWSASARLGTDTAYDESAFRTGKRLVTKIFNAGRLIVGRLRSAGIRAGDLSAMEVTSPLDRGHLAVLSVLVTDATELMTRFDTAAALQMIETWFWNALCDNYIELTKGRAYAEDRSALATWSLSLSAILRLLAPFVPYITEEVWSWYHGSDAQSIHLASWPRPDELAEAEGDASVFEAAVAVLTQVRRGKTQAHVSLRKPVRSITVTGPQERIEKLAAALSDVLSAGAIARAELRAGGGTELSVSLDFPDT